MNGSTTEPSRDRIPARVTDQDTGRPRPLFPEEGGSQSGSQIDESRIDDPFDDHSPNATNDVS